MADTPDPFAAKRDAMRRAFFGRFFCLGCWIGATDTYKRTMWAAVPEVALARAAYTLTMRKPLPEPGAGNQLIMAGHEAMLAQWFLKPLRRSDIELARKWYSERSNVKAFPHELWDAILARHRSDYISLPVDVWGFPGGQAFVPGVPCLSFEGMGGAISYLEPAMCRYYAPIIQATKARLMKLATPRDAEFGLRASPNEIANLVLLLARFVGGGGRITSNDTAEFMYPELFCSTGTVGHELMSAAESFDRTLGEAETEMMDRFVSARGDGALLTDLIDAETVGLEDAIRVIRSHPESDRVGIRIDSGDLAQECLLYFRRMQEAGIGKRVIVFEDEVDPVTVRRVYDYFRHETGQEPTMLFPGAGGYWWRLVHRDTVAAAFKRSATGEHPNVKFSNSPGKESLGGYLRVYGKGDVMIVADASEPPLGEPLLVKLVEDGRIVYRESFERQAARADETWERYRRFELSPVVEGYMRRFREMRQREIADLKRRKSS
jgi:nicotinic acid phosphoribosyltransferase